MKKKKSVIVILIIILILFTIKLLTNKEILDFNKLTSKGQITTINNGPCKIAKKIEYDKNYSSPGKYLEKTEDGKIKYIIYSMGLKTHGGYYINLIRSEIIDDTVNIYVETGLIGDSYIQSLTTPAVSIICDSELTNANVFVK